jgi:uncharacterized RDD family membrane protein YckC
MSNTTYILDHQLLVSSGRRFLNSILDLIFFVLFLVGARMVIEFITSVLGLDAVRSWMSGLGELWWNCIGFIASLLYYILLEGFFGRTLGKFVTGTIVVDVNGKQPSFGTICKRTLSRLIPFDSYSFLGNARGWHDSNSDTYVVDKKSLEESVQLFHEFNSIGHKETDV